MGPPAAALLALLVAAGCTDISGGGPAEESGARELLIVVYDRSMSISDHQLEHAEDVTRDLVDQLDHGDRVVAMDVLERGLDDAPRRWSQEVPDRRFHDREAERDSVRRSRFLRDVRQYLERYTDAADRGSRDGNNILATMHLVQEELDSYSDHRPRLVIFSDMLQDGYEIAMEGLADMPSDDWIPTEVERGGLPDLDDLCVVVVGARDDLRSNRAIRDWWIEYFEATGADLRVDNWKHRPASLPTEPCPAG